jgi:serine/threonine protein kinase
MEKEELKKVVWSDPLIKKKYKLIEGLGKGSFGVVMKAYERSTGKKVAIKLIKDIDINAYALRKLVREVDLLR